MQLVSVIGINMTTHRNYNTDHVIYAYTYIELGRNVIHLSPMTVCGWALEARMRDCVSRVHKLMRNMRGYEHV